MRNPENINRLDITDTKTDTIKLSSIPEFEIEDWDLSDPKQFKKYINTIEKIVRGSFEYRQFVGFLRDYVGMNKCSIYERITNQDSFKVKIHIHHEPITLYDIVIAVYNRRAANREPLSEDMVAKEVMYQHYMLRVGLIPLSETVHELVHNQFIFIPTTAVFGKYWELVDIYHDYMEPETLDTLKKIEEISTNFNMDENKKVLETHMIHLDTSESYDTDLDKVKQVLESRIDEIKESYKR
jgi:hypothetical protein